jgi:hypothetical protein
MNDSSIFGVSVRAWLAVMTVGSGLLFLYAIALMFSEGDLRLTVVVAVVGFINLALGYYLGQKTASGDTATATNTDAEGA